MVHGLAEKPAPATTGPHDTLAHHDGARRKAMLQVAVTEALACLHAGQIARACAHIDEVQDIAATSDTASYVVGLFYFNIGDPSLALQWFDRALALRPAFSDARRGRAITLQRLGRPLEALTTLQASLRETPDDHEALQISGVICQSLGRLDQALAAYEQALRIKPNYFEALLNRGALLEQLGRLDEALTAFDAVVALRPADATSLFNRACVRQKLGHLEAALADHEAARDLDPMHPENELNRGNVLQKLGRFAEALGCYDTALQLRPIYPQAYYNRGIAQQRLGRWRQSLMDFEEALAQKPDYAEALCNLGNVRNELGELGEALAAYDRALELKPRFRQAQINRANVLFALGRSALAHAAANDILRDEPAHPQALCICGAALQRMGRLDEALAHLDGAVHARPDYPEAWLNRGNVLQELGRLEDALASYDKALAIRPLYPEVLSSRGVALKELGRFEEGLADFDAALRLNPSYPDARNNRAGALLLAGELKEGFEAFESRWGRSNAPPKTLISPLPTWHGEPISGRRILVWDEQGLGDLIQFSRYLPLLAERGAIVTLLGRKSMFRVLATLPHAPCFVEAAGRQEAYDYQIALMSLPHAFGTSLETVPAALPYLHAEPENVERWALRLGREGVRIGICWRGNPTLNLQRSVPLAHFADLAAIDGVRLISLAKETSDARESDLGFAVETLRPDFDSGPDAFIDTAAVMAHCDLIVTSDTSIAHLAGALGRPVFLALKHVPDWRWLAKGDHSPWYPTMRLFRQHTRGDWAPLMRDITVAARRRAYDRSGLQAGSDA